MALTPWCSPQVRSANYEADPFVQEFRFKVRDEMSQVTGRVLPPPMLQYGGRVSTENYLVPTPVCLSVYLNAYCLEPTRVCLSAWYLHLSVSLPVCLTT